MKALLFKNRLYVIIVVMIELCFHSISAQDLGELPLGTVIEKENLMINTNFGKTRTSMNFSPNESSWESQFTNGRPHSCTIGVATGKATEDGRPMIWKTRDWAPHNHVRVRFDTSQKYSVLMVSLLASTWPIIGINERGFAMVFSLSSDLPQATTGLTTEEFLKYGLANCATVKEFESYLKFTNKGGRVMNNNFGAIDATGAAKIFEISGKEYWIYDANDTTIAPKGFLVRTNFSPDHGTEQNDGIERYLRSNDLCDQFIAGDSMNYQSLLRYHMRDLAASNGIPINIPYTDTSVYYPDVPLGGYCNGLTIANFLSEASGVIQGVRPGENPALSTMWTIQGMPATSIAIPYWPVGAPPVQACGPDLTVNELAHCSRNIRKEIMHKLPSIIYGPILEYIDTYDLRDGVGGGIWPIIFPAEDSIFKKTDSLMTVWRAGGADTMAMMYYSSEFAKTGVSVLNKAYDYLMKKTSAVDFYSMPDKFYLEQNYPNPFNPSTTIRYSLPSLAQVKLTIHDILGREVATLVNEEQSAGWKEVRWNAKDVSSGIYFYKLQTGQFVEMKKMILLK